MSGGPYRRTEEYPAVLGHASKRTVLVPENASRLVRELFEILNRNKFTIRAVAQRSGVNEGTISDWRARRSPTLANIEAVLNACGYELSIRERNDDHN